MSRQAERPAPETDACVFCGQNLAGSPVIGHYHAFFSAAYQDLKRNVADTVAALNRAHSDNAAVTFERAVRVLGERKQFWSRFCELPELEIDTTTVVRDWQAARDKLLECLAAKQSAPLDPILIADAVRTTV